MRLFTILAIIVVFLLADTPSGNSETTQSFTDRSINDYISHDSSQFHLTSVPWPFGPDPGVDEDDDFPDDEDAEESDRDRDRREREKDKKEDEESEPFSFFDIDNSDWDHDEPEYDDDPKESERRPPRRIDPEIYRQNHMDQWEWEQMQGDKVPFLIMMDSRTPGLYEHTEPRAAYFKALKHAAEILNGVDFRYEPRTDDVYLINNITDIPEHLFMRDREDFHDASKFYYETLLPQGKLTSNRTGRQVMSEAKAPGSSIANAFDVTRKMAFQRAIRDAYGKERALRNWSSTDTVTGTVTSWEIISEGWLYDEDKYYLAMRLWIQFD